MTEAEKKPKSTSKYAFELAEAIRVRCPGALVLVRLNAERMPADSCFVEVLGTSPFLVELRGGKYFCHPKSFHQTRLRDVSSSSFEEVLSIAAVHVKE